MVNAATAMANLLQRPAGEVVAQVRHWVAAGQAAQAAALLDAGLPQRPFEHDLHLAWAWTHWQSGASAPAEAILAGVLQRCPDSVEAILLLAEVLRTQARLQAVAGLVCGFAHAAPRPQPVLRQLAAFLEASRLPAQALQVCELALRQGADADLLAMAAGFHLMLGDFGQVRSRALGAWEAGADLEVRFLPYLLAMSRRYSDRDDPDFARLRTLAERLQRPRARASVHFALAKLHDDLGDYAQAAAHLRTANQAAASAGRDNVADWEQLERTVIAEGMLPAQAPPPQAPVPVFIVGLPRTGSTLLATRLAQCPGVVDRGELPIVPFLRQGLVGSGRLGEPAAMAEAAALYLQHLLQDDAPARWYLDKAPMNSFHLGLVMALFPHARILWCRRDRRDTALSIWMQSFVPGELDFAYDLASIGRVAAASERLLAHWQQRGVPLHVVDYEALVAQPQQTLAAVLHFLGVPDPSAAAATASGAPAGGAIATSSAWQARQRLHTRSLGRADLYARWIPELAERGG